MKSQKIQPLERQDIKENVEEDYKHYYYSKNNVEQRMACTMWLEKIGVWKNQSWTLINNILTILICLVLTKFGLFLKRISNL